MKRKTSNDLRTIRSFGHEKLDVFKISRQLVIDLYRETARLPSEEKFGLVSQIRRSAISIPANISEGAARRSKKEFTRFLLTARGSSTELRLLLDIAHATGLLADEAYLAHDGTLNRIFSMLNGLIRHSDTRAT
ncbi:MAG: four helix bundle protein [Acidobacteriota bacterium]